MIVTPAKLPLYGPIPYKGSFCPSFIKFFILLPRQYRDPGLCLMMVSFYLCKSGCT